MSKIINNYYINYYTEYVCLVKKKFTKKSGFPFLPFLHLLTPLEDDFEKSFLSWSLRYKTKLLAKFHAYLHSFSGSG
jgi:hypothetical protein